ncbi:MAG: substrate-binding domain-containing protein [Rivularia sp. (in: cyanobacteria)]
MFIYRWGFVGFIIGAFLLSACNSQNNPLLSTNNKKSENAATEGSGIEDNFGIQSISSTSSPTPALEESNTSINLPNVNPLELGGELKIGGSSTLYFLTEAIAERFKEEGYPGKVNVASGGTAKSFQLLCSEGKLDIVTSYGPISNEQIQACNRAGRQPVGFPVAVDTLTVVVSSQNNFLPSNLSKQDLRKVFTLGKWSDINQNWPDRPIKRFLYPAPWTGSSAVFARDILNGNANLALNATNTKLYQFEEEVIQNALISPDIVSILGYGYYKQHQKEVTEISIDGIAPDDTKKYPFTTKMYIYTDAKLIRTRPEVRGFVNFYLQNVDREVEDADSLALEETALNASKMKLLNVLGRAE